MAVAAVVAGMPAAGIANRSFVVFPLDREI
jgi:hypothetical protein